MADWATISSLATAGGTLVLAIATFSSVKSANRSARVAERALLAGVRPVLLPSRDDDPTERLAFGDGYRLIVPGHGAAIEVADGNVYMGVALRNGGAGPAVIHGWRATAGLQPSELPAGGRMDPPPLAEFRRQQLDLYIPAGLSGFWQGAVREAQDPAHEGLVAARRDGNRVFVDLLYGDHEGGQRTIARFSLARTDDGGELRTTVLRYWNLDREDPR